MTIRRHPQLVVLNADDTAPQVWQVSVNTDPPDARVTLVAGETYFGVRVGDTDEHLFALATPGTTPNQKGTLTVERRGYRTRTVEIFDVGPHRLRTIRMIRNTPWPRPPQPPEEQTWQAGVTTFPNSATAQIVVGATTVIGVPTPDSGQKLFTFKTPDQPLNGPGTLIVQAPEYLDGVVEIPDIGPPNPTLTDVYLEPAFVDLPALVPQDNWHRDPYNSTVFALADGRAWTLMEATSFKSYELYLTGQFEALDAHLGQLRDLGFNCHRVFGMCSNLFRFAPQDFGDRYYTELPNYVRYVATKFSLYTDFVVFPDNVLIMPDLAEEQAHWNRLADPFREVAGMILVSLQNEVDQKPNIIQFDQFNPHDGVICSHGSYGAVGIQVLPAWRWTELHTNDAYEWPRKNGHNTMEFGGPGVCTETTRPDHDGQVNHFEDAAAGAALLCAGSCFHSAALRYSEVIAGYELQCAEAFIRGASSVPLHCQGGQYKHRIDLELPNAGETGERVYQRGDDEACIVHVRMP